LIPLIAVLIVQKLIYKEAIARPLLLTRRPNWWWPFAMIFPLLLIGLTTLVAILFPGVTLDLGMGNYLSTVDATTSATMNNYFRHCLSIHCGYSLVKVLLAELPSTLFLPLERRLVGVVFFFGSFKYSASGKRHYS